MSSTTINHVGTRARAGITSAQNPSYTHTWRDTSSSHKDIQDHVDIFAPTPEPQQTPWVAEQRLQYQAPDKYTQRVTNMTIVGTGGSTDMAMVTHHTVQATPDGTMYKGILSDQAFEEEVRVAQQVQPAMPAIVAACDAYHKHSTDGWITTIGFVTCASKAGLKLGRAQFLALERSVPKDKLGRINYYQVAEAVERLCARQSPTGTMR